MGKLYLAQAPAEIRTGGIGSCIAVCLYSSTTKWGGLAHIMLPTRPESASPVVEDDLRYADIAIAVMYEQLQKAGVPTTSLIAKIVGGASMFPDVQGRSVRVGDRNIEAVKAALTAKNIKLVAEEIGGSVGRSVQFDLTTGIVSVHMSL